MPDLYLPAGLGAGVFTELLVAGMTREERERHLDALLIRPESFHPRVAVTRRAWFSIKETTVPPGGLIVDSVVADRSGGAICICQDAANPGRLVCKGYDVKVLPLFPNCNVVWVGAQFFAKGFIAFGIEPAKPNKHGNRSNDSLRPTKQLLRIWSGREQRTWPTPSQLESAGFNQAEIDLIRNQEKVLRRHGAARGRTRYRFPPVFNNLWREYRFDIVTTQVILQAASNHRQVNAADLDINVKYQLTLTAITKGQELAKFRNSAGVPNWKGEMLSSAPRLVKRYLDTRRGPDAPWLGAGPALLRAFGLHPGDSLERTIATFGRGAIRRRLDACVQYSLSKKDWLEWQFWKLAERLVRIHPNPHHDQVERAVMAFLRATDLKASDGSLDFDRVLNDEIARHLVDRFAWQPLHGFDKYVLEQAMLHVRLNPLRWESPHEVALPDEEIGPAEAADHDEEQ